MAAENDMRQVVERLRAEGGGAVLELAEFDRALEALLQTLERITTGTQDLHLAATNIVSAGTANALAWSAIQDQSGHLSDWISQFLVAFQQLHSGVQAWNISDVRNHSGLPISGKRLVPKD